MAGDQSAADTAAGAPMTSPEPYTRLARAREGRVLAGVCSGLGRHTGIDPVVLRIAFGLLTLGGGEGIPLYIAAALLMPAGPAATAPAEKVLRRRFDAPAVLAILAALLCLLVVGKVATSGGLSRDPMTVVTVFVLVLLVAHARNVNFAQAARSLPERLSGHPLDSYPADSAGPAAPSVAHAGERVSLTKHDVPGRGLPDGMIDLADFSGADPASEPVPAEPGQDEPGPVRARERRRSALTPITLLVALMAGAFLIPVAVGGVSAGMTGVERTQLIGAAALAAIGLGLVVGGWFGRPRGLTTIGTVLTVSLLTTAVAAEVPRDARFGDISWLPTDARQSEQTYRVAAGSGRLVLTEIPLSPGQRIKINAELLVGELTVVLPPEARVELDGRVGLGDLTIDRRVVGGPRSRASETLAPLGKNVTNPPVIELRVRAKVGDVEVTREAQ